MILERYSIDLAAYVVIVSACSYFAFATVVGTRLNVIERRTVPPGMLTSAIVAISAGIPLTAAVRGVLWWTIGTNDNDAGVAQLFELALVGAVVAACIGLACSALFRQRHTGN